MFVFERKTSELSHFVPKLICMTFPHAPKNSCMHISISSLLAGIDEILDPGVSGKGFWLPGTGREIENHIPVLREGNGNLQIAKGREGKGNLRLVFPGIPGNPGNHIKILKITT